jgi:hypothetical protein
VVVFGVDACSLESSQFGLMSNERGRELTAVSKERRAASIAFGTDTPVCSSGVSLPGLCECPEWSWACSVKHQPQLRHFVLRWTITYRARMSH